MGAWLGRSSGGFWVCRDVTAGTTVDAGIAGAQAGECNRTFGIEAGHVEGTAQRVVRLIGCDGYPFHRGARACAEFRPGAQRRGPIGRPHEAPQKSPLTTSIERL